MRELRHGKILFLLALLAGCGSSSGQGPQQALRRYVAAVQADKPAEAYALMDEGVRRQMTPGEFEARWRTLRAELRAQADQIKAVLDKPIKARALVTYPSGGRATLSYLEGRWQIDQGMTVASAATPADALKAFIRAVESRSYDAVTRHLARSVREGLERDIADRIAKLKQALGQEIEVTGGRARLQYDPRHKIELIQEDGEWRILDLD